MFIKKNKLVSRIRLCFCYRQFPFWGCNVWWYHCTKIYDNIEANAVHLKIIHQINCNLHILFHLQKIILLVNLLEKSIKEICVLRNKTHPFFSPMLLTTLSITEIRFDTQETFSDTLLHGKLVIWSIFFFSLRIISKILLELYG